jgi:LPXTG-motif cell wall-anchored protein
MGLFGLDSTSTATDSSQTAGANSKQIHGNATAYAEQGGVAVGANARLSTAPQFTNLKGNTITIQDTSPALLSALQALAPNSSNSPSPGLVGAILPGLTQPPTDPNAATTPPTTPNWGLWIGLGLLGLVALWFLFSKK